MGGRWKSKSKRRIKKRDGGGKEKHVRESRHRLQRHHLAGRKDAYVTLINMHSERIMQDV